MTIQTYISFIDSIPFIPSYVKQDLLAAGQKDENSRRDIVGILNTYMAELNNGAGDLQKEFDTLKKQWKKEERTTKEHDQREQEKTSLPFSGE